jgi:hypothetical protein
MEKTFESFQQEWFERTARGLITPSNAVAPDIYRINQTVRCCTCMPVFKS